MAQWSGGGGSTHEHMNLPYTESRSLKVNIVYSVWQQLSGVSGAQIFLITYRPLYIQGGQKEVLD